MTTTNNTRDEEKRTIIDMSLKLNVGCLWVGGGTLCDVLSRRSNCNIIFLCEKHKSRIEQLRHKFRGIPIIEDIHELANNLELLTQCDILFGEPPCVSNSSMAGLNGEREGLLGPDSGQIKVLFDALNKLIPPFRKPSLIVLENVKGLLTLPGEIGMDLLRKYGRLANYNGGEWRLVDCGVWTPGLMRERVVLAMWLHPCAWRGIWTQFSHSYDKLRVNNLSSFYLEDTMSPGTQGLLRTMKKNGTLCYTWGATVKYVNSKVACALHGVSLKSLNILSENEKVECIGDGLHTPMADWYVDRALNIQEGFNAPKHNVESTVWSYHTAGCWHNDTYYYVDVGLAPIPQAWNTGKVLQILREGPSMQGNMKLLNFIVKRHFKSEGQNTKAPEISSVRSKIWNESSERALYPDIGYNAVISINLPRRGRVHPIPCEAVVLAINSSSLFGWTLQVQPNKSVLSIELLPQRTYLYKDMSGNVKTYNESWTLKKKGDCQAHNMVQHPVTSRLLDTISSPQNDEICNTENTTVLLEDVPIAFEHQNIEKKCGVKSNDVPRLWPENVRQTLIGATHDHRESRKKCKRCMFERLLKHEKKTGSLKKSVLDLLNISMYEELP